MVDGLAGQQEDARQEEQPGLTIEELAESETCEEASRAGSQAGDLSPATTALLPASSAKQPLKWRQTTPVNTAMMFVPQQEAWYCHIDQENKLYRSIGISEHLHICLAKYCTDPVFY